MLVLVLPRQCGKCRGAEGQGSQIYSLGLENPYTPPTESRELAP